jgi:hypothetical protein
VTDNSEPRADTPPQTPPTVHCLTLHGGCPARQSVRLHRALMCRRGQPGTNLKDVADERPPGGYAALSSVPERMAWCLKICGSRLRP